MNFPIRDFSKTAIRHGRHQRKTAWHQIRGLYSLAISARRLTKATREQRAEAAETGESDVHADGRHGSSLRREQLLGAIEAHLNSILVRRDAEQRLELSDEMVGRDPYFARQRCDGRLRPVELR